jgi:hypothetical protein
LLLKITSETYFFGNFAASASVKIDANKFFKMYISDRLWLSYKILFCRVVVLNTVQIRNVLSFIKRYPY